MAQGGLADSRLVQHVEQVEIRPDVERQSVVGDPAVDGDADRGDPGRPREDAGQIGAGRPGQVELLENLRIAPCAADRDSLAASARSVERQGDIGRELSGKVEHAATAAIDPVNRDSQDSSASSSGTMCARLPDRPTLIVGGCSQRINTAAVLFTQFVDDPPLKLLDLR